MQRPDRLQPGWPFDHHLSNTVFGRADQSDPHRPPLLRGELGDPLRPGKFPKKAECSVGKNYLFSDELYILHILCEQFLLFAESKALRGQKMTMKELTTKLDQLFAINEYPVFQGYTDALREKAKDHAEVEWHRLMELIRTGQHLPAPDKAA